MNIENSAFQHNLFYLIGFQRSGTTLLCHLLDKHPGIVCAEEPEITKRLVFRQLELMKDVDFDSIKQSLRHYCVESDKYSELVDQYIAGDLDDDSFVRLVYTLFNNKGAHCVGAKEVIDLSSHRYDYFKKLLAMHRGKLKIVFLERNIKGVVNSFMKMGFFPDEVFFLPRGRKKINTFFLRMFAGKYLQAVNNALQLLDRENSVHVYYEDLLHDPKKELRKIYHFLNVDASEDILRQVLDTSSRGIRCDYNGIIKETADSWTNGLTPGHVSWLDKLAAQKIKHKA